MSSLAPEQLVADRSRLNREIATWRQRGLVDEHPNIARRLARIAVIDKLTERAT